MGGEETEETKKYAVEDGLLSREDLQIIQNPPIIESVLGNNKLFQDSRDIDDGIKDQKPLGDPLKLLPTELWLQFMHEYITEDPDGVFNLL